MSGLVRQLGGLCLIKDGWDKVQRDDPSGNYTLFPQLLDAPGSSLLKDCLLLLRTWSLHANRRLLRSHKTATCTDHWIK